MSKEEEDKSSINESPQGDKVSLSGLNGVLALSDRKVVLVSSDYSNSDLRLSHGPSINAKKEDKTMEKEKGEKDKVSLSALTTCESKSPTKIMRTTKATPRSKWGFTRSSSTNSLGSLGLVDWELWDKPMDSNVLPGTLCSCVPRPKKLWTKQELLSIKETWITTDRHTSLATEKAPENMATNENLVTLNGSGAPKNVQAPSVQPKARGRPRKNTIEVGQSTLRRSSRLSRESSPSTPTCSDYDDLDNWSDKHTKSGKQKKKRSNKGNRRR